MDKNAAVAWLIFLQRVAEAAQESVITLHGENDLTIDACQHEFKYADDITSGNIRVVCKHCGQTYSVGND